MTTEYVEGNMLDVSGWARDASRCPAGKDLSVRLRGTLRRLRKNLNDQPHEHEDSSDPAGPVEALRDKHLSLNGERVSIRTTSLHLPRFRASFSRTPTETTDSVCKAIDASLWRGFRRSSDLARRLPGRAVQQCPPTTPRRARRV